MVSVNEEKSFLRFFRMSNPEKKNNTKLESFYEQRDISEEISLELKDRAKAITKRAKDLKKGIKMLPDDLPVEFRKAIDSAIETMEEDIQNEARDIVESADEARYNADNTLYELRKISEKYERKVRNIDRICSVPLLGSLGDKSSSELHQTLGELISISTDTNEFYESLLFSKNLVKDLIKEDNSDNIEK